MSDREVLRRKFLALCGAAGLGYASPLGLSTLTRAGEPGEEGGYAGPYFVVLNASGGWDTTYLMDPKGVSDINRLYRAGDILTAGVHRFAPTAEHIEKGMSNEDFFGRYGQELLVLNGLDYSVNNHTPCSRYMATGKLDSLAYPTFAALVAACKGADAPLAFLTFGNYSATGNLVPMSRVPYLQSLNLLAKAEFVGGSDSHRYSDAFVTERVEQTIRERHAAAAKGPTLPRVERSRSMLYGAQVSSKTLSRVVPYIPKKRSEERLGQQAEIALAAFKAGVCVSANLSIGQFDSHNSNDPDQMRLIPELLAGIDGLLRKAEELQIRERLVVVIQSEMGRTPSYNAGGGKDHWSIGSVMFLGAGIAGNRVVGTTDEAQQAVPVHPQSLLADRDAGIRIRPEHVHQALRELAGISEHPFAAQFPLEVAADQRLETLWS